MQTCRWLEMLLADPSSNYLLLLCCFKVLMRKDEKSLLIKVCRWAACWRGITVNKMGRWCWEQQLCDRVATSKAVVPTLDVAESESPVFRKKVYW